MVDKRLLDSKIILSGISRRDIAERLGICYESLSKKINERGTCFNIDEIETLCGILSISKAEIPKIFFA